MIEKAFGAERRPFRLLGAQWRDLEKARDCGLGVLAARLAPLVALKETGPAAYPGGLMGAVAGGHLGSARLDDVREPILQGLIGGGLSSTEAGELVRKVFDEALARDQGPMFIWCDLAFEIVSTALIGLEDEPIDAGELKGAAKVPPKRRSRTARRGSSTSMQASA